jgi:S1-C subfamily serine protease
VDPGGLAARSGLAADDLILRADGKPASQVAPLLALVRSSKARTIQISLLRAGKPVELQLRLND